MNKKRKIAVAIFGPTSVGKTDIGIRLAYEKGEIISVDSMQVYKFMNIGTAKPSIEDLNKVKHYLIDIITPEIQFTAGDFKREAQKLILKILEKNKIPFLIGGTGLYFMALIRGMVEIPRISNDIREYIKDKWEKIGQERLYSILEKLDYEYSNTIHPNDKQRTMRAIEVIVQTKKKFSSFLKQDNIRPDINYINIGIERDRKQLYETINKRVDLMIESGLLNEVKKLREMGYKKSDPGLNAIGYKELFNYLDGYIDYKSAVDLIKRNTRRYAKRQFVWFKNLDNVKWFKNNEYNEIKEYIFQRLNNL